MKFLITSSIASKKRIATLFAEYYNPEINDTLIIDTEAQFIRDTKNLKIESNEDVQALAPVIPHLIQLQILNIHIKPWQVDNYITDQINLPESIRQLTIDNTFIKSLNLSNCQLQSLQLINNPVLEHIDGLNKQNQIIRYSILNNQCNYNEFTIPNASYKSYIDFTTYVMQPDNAIPKHIKISEMAGVDTCVMSNSTAKHLWNTAHSIIRHQITPQMNDLEKTVILGRYCLALFKSEYKDDELFSPHTTANALHGKPAVCESKSKAFAALLNIAGINARVVSCELNGQTYLDANGNKLDYIHNEQTEFGNASNTANHAIICVTIDNKDYYGDLHNMNKLYDFEHQEPFLLGKSDLLKRNDSGAKYYIDYSEKFTQDTQSISTQAIAQISAKYQQNVHSILSQLIYPIIGTLPWNNHITHDNNSKWIQSNDIQELESTIEEEDEEEEIIEDEEPELIPKGKTYQSMEISTNHPDLQPQQIPEQHNHDDIDMER